MEDLSRYTNPQIDEQILFCASDQSLRAARSHVEMGLNRKQQLAMYFPHQADAELLSVRSGNHPLIALLDKLPRYQQHPYTEFPVVTSLSARDIWMIMTEYEDSYDELRRSTVSNYRQMQDRLKIDQVVLDKLYQDFTAAGGLDFDNRISFIDRLLKHIPLKSSSKSLGNLLNGLWSRAKLMTTRSDGQKIK